MLVWPGLWDAGRGAVMRGVFLGDGPVSGEGGGGGDGGDDGGGGSVVGLRMPYSLPLRRYGGDEVPWVASASYEEVDWMGRGWKD